MMQLAPFTPGEELMLPAEVASAFRVDPRTVTAWANTGTLTAIHTLIGHRRFRSSDFRAFLAGLPITIDATR